ncbi:MAG: YbaN family protein [Armatimonadetes bacterium]|nr:YbaN family protein [Armatimonadota bacterium]
MSVGRRVWASVGLVFVGLGFVGAFVPGMPTTVFLIVALYCFKRGSAKFEKWLLEHRVFGPTLRDWEQYRGMRAKSKRAALLVMWPCLAVSCLVLLQRPPILAIVFASGVIATWVILTRPTVPDDTESRPDAENDTSTAAA